LDQLLPSCLEQDDSDVAGRVRRRARTPKKFKMWLAPLLLGAVTAAPPTVLFNVIIDDLGSAYFGPRAPLGKRQAPKTQ